MFVVNGKYSGTSKYNTYTSRTMSGTRFIINSRCASYGIGRFRFFFYPTIISIDSGSLPTKIVRADPCKCCRCARSPTTGSTRKRKCNIDEVDGWARR